MSAVLVTQKNITEYLPQKAPIVLIDSINKYDTDSITTGFLIEDSHIFVKNGYLQEPGIIENIAQTAAAKAGYEAKKMGLKPLLGFIGEVKKLKIFDLPKIGETLETTVVIKMEVMGITLIFGSSECNGKKIAECEMKIVIQKS